MHSSIANAKALIGYLENYQSKFFAAHQNYLTVNNLKSHHDFKEIQLDIQKFEENRTIKAENIYKNGTLVYAKVVKVLSWGIMFEIEDSHQGAFAHSTDIDDHDFYSNGKYPKGKILKIKITAFKPKHSKYNCEIVNEEHFTLMT